MRVLGPDEDPFTLAAAALERLVEDPHPVGPLETIHLAGTFPASIDPWLPELLGHPVTITRHAPTAEGFLSALHSCSAELLGTHAVVGVDIPATGVLGRSGAVAVGLLVGSGPGLEMPRSLSPSLPFTPGPPIPQIGQPPICAPAFALHAAFGHAWKAAGHRSVNGEVGRGGLGIRDMDPIEWRGDWSGPTASPIALDPGKFATVGDRHLFAVSEGAYVPRARYLENLPSRWRFVGERCGGCSAITFPVRGSCRACHSSDRLSRMDLPLHGGTVLASTVIARGGQPTEFDDQVEAMGPYGVVLAELQPGVRVTLQVADALPGSVQVGDQIHTRLRRLYPMEGEWRYGRKAVPRPSSSL